MSKQSKYKLKTLNETFGSTQLKLEVLADLNATIDELFSEIDAGADPEILEDLCPYFGVIWPAARALTDHLSTLGASTFAGHKVLEVGCGLALPSLLLAKFGAEVVATDFHPEVPVFLKRNMELNGISNLEYRELNWKEVPAGGHFDWVIGSDVLYEKEHPERVASVLSEYAGKKGRIVIADPMRPYLQPFVDAMVKLGFRYDSIVRTVPDTPVAKDVMLLFFQRK